MQVSGLCHSTVKNPNNRLGLTAEGTKESQEPLSAQFRQNSPHAETHVVMGPVTELGKNTFKLKAI